jgi:hypothetical protein
MHENRARITEIRRCFTKMIGSMLLIGFRFEKVLKFDRLSDLTRLKHVCRNYPLLVGV